MEQQTNNQFLKDLNCIIIDDESSLLDILEHNLKPFFTNIYKTTDPLEAFALMLKLHPHVIITDYLMPKMNGLQLIKMINSHNLNTIKVLCTAYGDREVLKTAINENIFSYIEKPIKQDELLDVVNKIINYLIKRHNETGDKFQIDSSIFRNKLINEYNLTQQKLQIAEALKNGVKTSKIAEELKISQFTVNTHIRNIRKKTNLTNSKKNLRSMLQLLAA